MVTANEEELNEIPLDEESTTKKEREVLSLRVSYIK